jgi:hypothetical protein
MSRPHACKRQGHALEDDVSKGRQCLIQRLLLRRVGFVCATVNMTMSQHDHEPCPTRNGACDQDPPYMYDSMMESRHDVAKHTKARRFGRETPMADGSALPKVKYGPLCTQHTQNSQHKPSTASCESAPPAHTCSDRSLAQPTPAMQSHVPHWCGTINNCMPTPKAAPLSCGRLQVLPAMHFAKQRLPPTAATPGSHMLGWVAYSMSLVCGSSFGSSRTSQHEEFLSAPAPLRTCSQDGTKPKA